MTYELWDTASSNIIGEFDSEADALAAVLEAVHLTGVASAAAFTLIGAFDDGAVKGIAGGQDLLERARRHDAKSSLQAS